MQQIELTFEQKKNLFDDLNPEIVKAFWKYHAENGHIWDLFKRFAFELKRAGRKRYSITAIGERIRWHMAVETAGDDFKLNNNYKACYARLLILTYPEFTGFFETRCSPGTRKNH